MRIGYLDCPCGLAGDMILGALLDAGCKLERLQEVIARLSLPGVTLAAQTVTRAGFAATQARVNIEQDRQHHRHLSDILAIIAGAGLAAGVAERARRVFEHLAQAEAEAHGIPIEKVHFHEVGAADAIVDIVGACAGLEILGVQRLLCSPIPTGSGTVTCAHGVLPVPAPATARLLRGVPILGGDVEAELTTPTGAALATTLADAYGPLPEMKLEALGCGAGTRDFLQRANVLRLFVGETADSDACDRDAVCVLEAQLDDCPGQNVAYAASRALEAGALDAYIVPIIMKKGRPGQLLTVLCRPEDAPKLEQLLFAETSTFGVRRQEARRCKLIRRRVTVETQYGPVAVKVGRGEAGVERAWPEYEDCAAAARKTGLPLERIQQETLRVWAQMQG
jgi:pyridinium-3,5-bisthiocarboxylic acid mononucleotide nickel chelatase